MIEKQIPMMKTVLCLILLFIAFPCLQLAAAGPENQTMLFKGQTVYVPVYSHIYSGNREKPFLLATTVSIRNTDPNHSITILLADYYDSKGKMIESYLKKSVKLKPLASIRYVVKESDRTGGSGANFIIKWKSDHDVNPPVIESIMIGTQNQQGISFTSRGKVIKW